MSPLTPDGVRRRPTRAARTRKEIIVAAAAAGAVLASAGAAGASSTASTPAGQQVLDLLCQVRGGAAVSTPFAIARCQEARGNTGFEIERLVCEGLLDAHFASAPSFGRPHRITWSCFDPSPAQQ